MRIADAAGINLATVRGSGPGGRILQRDVETAVRAAAPPPAKTEEAAVEEGERARSRPAPPSMVVGARRSRACAPRSRAA
jgi:pyruvate dehydrogenase E2 component (dihydrolipoamide acetyltransferase)